MAKVARKSIAPKVRTVAAVIDDLAAIKAQASEIDKACKKLEQELADFLGEDAKQDGIYQGYLYTMMLKRTEGMYLDNDKVLTLLGAQAYENCKSPRVTVRKTFVKKEH